MENVEYGITKAKPRNLLPEIDLLRVPYRDLLRVPYRDGKLVVAYPAFGPNTYKNNLAEMKKDYYHSEQFPNISFTPATTSESISASAYKFGEMAKKQIFNPNWLQAGPIVRTSKGVFSNPPRDKDGNPIIDEKILKSYLNGAKKVNGIYLVESPRDFGFAPYETFSQGVQDSKEFAEGGLARLLEHSEGKVAENLKEISSPKFYPREVNVFGFDKVKEPVLRVAYLDSIGFFGDGGLHVSGDDSGDGWDDDRLFLHGDIRVDDVGGCAFGVFSENAEGVSPKN